MSRNRRNVAAPDVAEWVAGGKVRLDLDLVLETFMTHFHRTPGTSDQVALPHSHPLNAGGHAAAIPNLGKGQELRGNLGCKSSTRLDFEPLFGVPNKVGSPNVKVNEHRQRSLAELEAATRAQYYSEVQ